MICHLTSFISETSAVIFFNVIFDGTSPSRRRLFGRALSRSSTPNWLFDLWSKKTLSYVRCHASDQVCFTANTQMTSFSFQILVRRRSLFLIFLDSGSLFLLDWLGTHFFGRTLTRSHKLFFLPMDYFFGCVLEETHGTTILEARRDC